jgi:hypothetical protein
MGAEQRTVLEQDAELLAHLVKALLTEPHDLVAVDPDLAPLRLEQAQDVLEQHGLPVAGRAEDGCDPPFGHVERDVFEHGVRAERLRHPA